MRVPTRAEEKRPSMDEDQDWEPQVWARWYAIDERNGDIEIQPIEIGRGRRVTGGKGLLDEGRF